MAERGLSGWLAQVRHAREDEWWVQRSLAVAFSWYIVWQATITPARLWPDTTLYQAQAGLPIWSARFWYGIKPPLTSLLWKLTGGASGFTLAQSVIFVASWLFLASTFATFFTGLLRRASATVLVLVFASSAPVMIWNRSVLSDSLALSAVAVLMAAVLRYAGGGSTRQAAYVVLAALLNVLVRYSQIVPVALVALVVLVVDVSRRRPDRSRRRGVVLFGLLLLVALLSSGLAKQSGVTSLEMPSLYATRVFPLPGRVAWFAAHGMPDAPGIDRQAARTPASPSGKVVIATSPVVTSWLASHGESLYVQWLLTHPLTLLSDPIAHPGWAYYSDGGNVLVYAAPNRTDAPWSALLYPGWRWCVGEALLGILLGFMLLRRVDRTTWILIALGVIGVATMLAAWDTSGQETDRHMLEGAVMFRMSALMLLAWGALRWRRATVSALGARLTSSEAADVA